MHTGMLDHLQQWIFHCFKTHERLSKYNAIRLFVPAYHNPTPKTKSYKEVSKWNGKEMKEMSTYLLGGVTQSPRGGKPAQCPRTNHTIQCTRTLLEFYMYARYKSHDDATLSYMADDFDGFHTLNYVFLFGRAGIMGKVKVNTLGTELVKKRKVDKETKTATWTLSQKQRETNAGRDYISHEMNIPRQTMPTSTVRKSTSCLIGPNRFVDKEPGNSILPRAMNKHITQTSRMDGMPPITISTPCHK